MASPLASNRVAPRLASRLASRRRLFNRSSRSWTTICETRGALGGDGAQHASRSARHDAARPRRAEKSGGGDRIAPAVLFKCNASTKWVVTFLNSLALWTRPHRYEGPFIVFGSIAAVYLTNYLKRMINQGRPDGAPFTDPGMPSSHALLSFFIATSWDSTGLLYVASPSPLRASIWLGAAAVAWLRAFAPPQFLWIETEEMRAMDGATLLTRVGRHAGLPTAHLAALPSAVRGACERWRFFDPADGRARTHDHALPTAEAALLREVYAPFNALLGRVLGGQLGHIGWLKA